MYRKVIIIVVIQVSSVAFGYDLPENFVPVRPKGMGGAFTAVANDHNSVWTNPAGIARIRKHRSRKFFHLLTLPNLSVGGNRSSRSFYRQFKLERSTAGSQSTTSSNIESAAEEFSGSKPLWARVSANPLLFFEAAKGTPMVLGLYTDSRVELSPGDDASQARVSAVSDVGALIGVSFTNWVNRLNFGLQIRPSSRFSFDDSVDYETLADASQVQKLVSTHGNALTAIALDMGLLYTLADFWFPTLGIAILNLPIGCKDDYLNPFSRERERVCGTKYRGSVKNSESLYLVDPADLRVGVSITPRIFHKLSVRLALGYHHLAVMLGESTMGLGGIDTAKQLHAGIEIFSGNPLSLPNFSFRGGINQGMATFGLSLRLNTLYLEFASYGQDISTTPSSSEDRRFVMTVSTEL